MENNKKLELRNIFKFLCTGDKNHRCEDNTKFKTQDLIFGLECYGTVMDNKKKSELIEELRKKGEEYYIDFDEFLDFFHFKKKTKHQKLNEEEKKKISRQIFFLIYQLLGIDDENKKLGKEDIKKLFYIAFNLDEISTDRKKGKGTENNSMISILSNEQKNKSNILKKLSNPTSTPNPTATGVNEINEKSLIRIKRGFENVNEELVDDLIKCIDYDEDGKINLKDFEFLLDVYFSEIEKK